MRRKILEIPKFNRRFVFCYDGSNERQIDAAKWAIKYLNVKVDNISFEEEFFENLKLNPKTEFLCFRSNIISEERIDSILNSLSHLKELKIEDCNITYPTNSTWTLDKLTSLTLNNVKVDFNSKVIEAKILK